MKSLKIIAVAIGLFLSLQLLTAANLEESNSNLSGETRKLLGAKRVGPEAGIPLTSNIRIHNPAYNIDETGKAMPISVE